jgi:2-methylcitrate dehydratase PrpD
MTTSLVQQLAAFSNGTTFAALPPEVIHECKRILLDSMGCALAATEEMKGLAGIQYGRQLAAVGAPATILGTPHRVSPLGAAYANGELINTLDMDAVLPPGHVSPYVVPGALAVAESTGASGKRLIEALALSHEMSNRLGKAMDYLRDTKDGKVNPPKIFGYSSTVFGATAAIGKVKGFSVDVMAQALGIAGCVAPVNSQVAWFQHAPSSTIKYLHAGVLVQSAFTAALMAEFGHRGDVQVLDDREYGFPRFIGTSKWEPEAITRGLGEDWRFPAEASYKPYPHCRILHALLDVMGEILDMHQIRPEEIESIKVYVEGMVEQPVWLNRRIEHVQDAQFSIAHGIALGAHRIKPGKAWMDPTLVFGDSVLRLMDKVTHEVHPDYVKLLTSQGASRPAKLELRARGQLFVGEKRYPKGSPSPDPSTTMTDAELVAKFRHNADGVLTPSQADQVIEMTMHLDQVEDVGQLVHQAACLTTSEVAVA